LSSKQQFLATVTNDKRAIPTSNNYNRALSKLRNVEEKLLTLESFIIIEFLMSFYLKYELLCVEDINTAEIKRRKKAS